MSPVWKSRVAGTWVDSNAVGAVRVAGDWVPFGPDDEPEGQTIFGNEVPVNLDNNDGDSYTLGTWFYPQVNGTATHGRWYFPITSPTNPVVIAIFRDGDQAVLGSTTFPAGLNSGWHQAAFSSPIPLVADTSYRVAVLTPNRYVSTSGYFGTDKTSGDIYCPPVAGRFAVNSSLTWPDQNFGQASYWSDLVFVPD